MSRIGRKPITIPDKVTVVADGRVVKVNGPKGSIEMILPIGIGIEIADGSINVQPVTTPTRRNRGFQGLVRAQIANMILGVSVGFEKKVKISGVGYRAQMQGKKITLHLGYSHPVILNIPDDINLEIDKQQVNIKVSGCDKQKVGQMAANIRSVKPPEPYKGKGVTIDNEVVVRKAGKSGK